ncbi:uncharacterized protein LOC128199640 [Bicyclus anynana]|uniref:Uncharacterized protein LOC128199640 n=1 Tax=Bicyclus anynana TaxID=110368 RepID=A0ABM3M4I7_BICAN|nr:uncharacterized protein LOC128199640 [Bicyclus anynana]
MPCLGDQRPLRQTHNLPVSNFSASEEILIEPVSQLSSMHCDVLSQGKENNEPSSTHTLEHKSAPDALEMMNTNQQNVNTKKRKVISKVKKHCVKMTKSEQELYKKLTSVQRKLSLCKNRLSNNAKQLKVAKKLSSNPEFLKIMESVPASAKILLMLQFREQGKKAKGRRFNIQEKILSLTILKQSPKAYRFIRKIFTLPAPQTLRKLLTRANIKPGINKKIFMQLKSKSAEMKSANEKLCLLIFDEMSLKTNVTYNERKDTITGFVTNGTETKPLYANHAQVFMIRGLHRNYKQPVSYTFSAGATKGPELAR